MNDKTVIEVTNRCFRAFRKQLEAEDLDSDAEVLVQRLVIARINSDAEMGQGELETDAPRLAIKVEKKLEVLLPKALTL